LFIWNLRPISARAHLLDDMIDLKAGSFARWFLRTLAVLPAVALLLLLFSPAQTDPEKVRPFDPLPQDAGSAGLQLMFRRLGTTARLMHTTAHPDDEDGGMMTVESRGHGDTVLLLTLNRGEGGQNKVGSNLFDVLGVLRTLELTASDRYYGVEQRFTRVADFGFSKNPDETFQKWQGHDIALADIVRVIRTFRPDVLVSRFQGTDRDGHGNHQASGIVTHEAFRAAADPNRFPEQIKEGLLPWQAKKFYFDNVCPFRSNECSPENYTVKLSTGEKDPLLRMTYIQFAMEGLRHQLSQGAGGWSIDGGPHYAFYRLVDSALPPTVGKDDHEQDFFDGIDTSLPGLASRLGDEEAQLPWLRPELTKVADNIELARKASEKDALHSPEPLFAIVELLRQVVDRVDKSDLSEPARRDLLARLREKEEQAQSAVNFAMNVTLSATVAPAKGVGSDVPREEDALTAVSPGQALTLRVKLHNGSKYPLFIGSAHLEAPGGWVRMAEAEKATITPGEDYYANFGLKIPAKVAYTRPYWHRDNPETDAINKVDDESYATLAFPPPALQSSVHYQIAPSPDRRLSIQGWTPQKPPAPHPYTEISCTAHVPFTDKNGALQKRSLAVVPAFSVTLEPGSQVVPVAGTSSRQVTVGVSYNLSSPSQGFLRLTVPHQWRVLPEQVRVNFSHRGEKRDFKFEVTPAQLTEGRAEVRAVLDAGGNHFSEGYSVVTREDLDTFYYYQPAVQRVSIVDVKIPQNLRIGYIMGAGDDIPTVLRQVGLDVTVIPADKLATEDLARFGTIVLGIRTYDTQKDVAANNRKLLDFVSAGGTLVVQYEADTGNFNGGNFTPYPATLSRGRVSVEEAPVEILAPQDSSFNSPNHITQRDFEGWVQERGLYFMDKWDDKFTPLLASHDPGEENLKGGLLRAQYGKGTYIYTGYAFFRQLPAGVPGAVRLYVNLLSAGRQSSVGGRQSLGATVAAR
jgi:LmbE family N-acetylglucosaminyl deacetylase